MAEKEPTMSGGQEGGGIRLNDEAMLQPAGAVEMKAIDKSQDTASAGPTVSTRGGLAPGETERSASSMSKGKEKDVSDSLAVEPSTTSKERSDSLSIQGEEGIAAAAPNPDGPTCNITLLLTTGSRHPYRIDEKYLAKRNVEVPELTESGKKDPFSISVYKLKELILREWRDDWDNKPTSPDGIRLIHFGKLLEDKEPLKKYQFSAEAPNVVHMSVKPAEMMEEDEAAKGKGGGRDGRNRDGGGGCGCCVIL